MTYHDVTVLGVGWSGVVAIKYMKEEGLTVLGLERRDGIGGLWYYSDDPNEKTVMKSTRTTSSSTLTEMSDYPMPEEIGIFPHHSKILEYLRSYCEHFDLYRHMRFNTTVEKVEKKDNLWHVTVSSGETFTSKFLVPCTGEPTVDDPRDSIFSSFEGSIYHAKEIKEPLEEHRNCRLLVFGGGETAADICAEWYDHTSCIYWCAPRGQHFFRRYSKVLPWKEPQALDKASSLLLTSIAPFHYSKPGLSWVCKWTTSGSLLAYQGHGIPEWRNKSEFMHLFINKNGHVLDMIDYERFVPKGAIECCNGKEVTFADGSKQEFDVVIVSTGYKVALPYLPEKYTNKTFRDRYKHVFDNDDPTLAFVGYVRPVIGSMPSVAETQARWVAKVFSGKVELISKEERLKVTEEDAKYWKEYFQASSQRLDRIVEEVMYVNNIAKLAKVYPNLWHLFKSNIYHWYVAVISPYNTALYQLNDPEHRDQAIATLERHRKGTTASLHLLLILFLRIIWFDWWCGKLEYLKYNIQTSKHWPTVRDTAPMKFVNWVWCLPKAVAFDNKTTLPPM